LKVADQCKAEALFLNSRPAEAYYGKNSRCPSLLNLTRSLLFIWSLPLFEVLIVGVFLVCFNYITVLGSQAVDMLLLIVLPRRMEDAGRRT
jgi:hypothetical protein